MNNYKKRFKNITLCTLLLLSCILSTTVAFAHETGSYLVDRVVSYVNPSTGVTEDGGTNITLGQSMSESLVEESILVEAIDEKTYATIGLGLSSNISEVTFSTKANEADAYQVVEAELTSSCERNQDICNHYTIAIPNMDQYIKIDAFVTPMGRTVTFFVKLVEESIRVGEEPYIATKFKAYSEQVTSQTNAEVQTQELPQSNVDTQDGMSQQDSVVQNEDVSQENAIAQEENVAKEESLVEEKDTAKAVSLNENQKSNTSMMLVVVGVVMVLGGFICAVVMKKRGKNS